MNFFIKAIFYFANRFIGIWESVFKEIISIFKHSGFVYILLVISIFVFYSLKKRGGSLKIRVLWRKFVGILRIVFGMLFFYFALLGFHFFLESFRSVVLILKVWDISIKSWTNWIDILLESGLIAFVFLFLFVYILAKYKRQWIEKVIRNMVYGSFISQTIRLVFVWVLPMLFLNSFFLILSFYGKYYIIGDLKKDLPFYKKYTIGWTTPNGVYVFPGLVKVDIVPGGVVRLSHIKGGYIGEYLRDGKGMLCFLDGNFKIRKVYDGVYLEKMENLWLRNRRILGRASPDGKYFLFYGIDERNGRGGVWILDIKSGEFSFILKEDLFADSRYTENLYVSWYGNNKLIFYSDKGARICTYNLEDGRIEGINIFKDKPPDYCKQFEYYLFSSDKRYVSYFENCSKMHIRDLFYSENLELTFCSLGGSLEGDWCIEYPLMWLNCSEGLLYSIRHNVYTLETFMGVCSSINEYICLYDLRSKSYLPLGFLNTKHFSPFMFKWGSLVDNVIKKSKKYFFYFCVVSGLWLLNLIFLLFYRKGVYKRFFAESSGSSLRWLKLGFKLNFIFLNVFLLLTFFSFCMYEFNFGLNWMLNNFVECVGLWIWERFLVVSMILVAFVSILSRYFIKGDIRNYKNFFVFSMYFFGILFVLVSGLEIFYVVIILIFYLFLFFGALRKIEELVSFLKKWG